MHHDSIVIYRNKTIFITTGTLGGPRSDYNAFRIVDIYSNGTVAPRYAPSTSANSSMNSYNIEKAIIRYWVDRDYSGVFLNISRELGISFGNSVSVYLDSPSSNNTIERILYDTQSRETMKPDAKIEILGESGAIRTIYRVDLSAQEIYRPQGIIVRSPSLETSLKPNIINIDVDPRQPRQGIDPIRVSVEISRGSTCVYRVEVMLRASMSDEGSVDLWEEALPSWDYTRYTVVFKGVNASKAILLVRAYDLYGNTAEGKISITFREIQRTTISPPIASVITITQPTVYITTQPAIIVNTSATAIISARGPTMPAETIITTSQLTSTYTQSAIGNSFGLIVGIVIAVVGIALVVILFTRRRT